MVIGVAMLSHKKLWFLFPPPGIKVTVKAADPFQAVLFKPCLSMAFLGWTEETDRLF